MKTKTEEYIRRQVRRAETHRQKGHTELANRIEMALMSTIRYINEMEILTSDEAMTIVANEENNLGIYDIEF